jgi:hypothetical protein
MQELQVPLLPSSQYLARCPRTRPTSTSFPNTLAHSAGREAAIRAGQPWSAHSRVAREVRCSGSQSRYRVALGAPRWQSGDALRRAIRRSALHHRESPPKPLNLSVPPQEHRSIIERPGTCSVPARRQPEPARCRAWRSRQGSPVPWPPDEHLANHRIHLHVEWASTIGKAEHSSGDAAPAQGASPDVQVKTSYLTGFSRRRS